MTDNTQFNWPRFWVPRESEPTLGSDAFLYGPDHWLGRVQPAQRLEQLSDQPFLILVGEPGSGKTTALKEAIKAVGEGAPRIVPARTLVDVRNVIAVPELESMLNRASEELGLGELFIDSVDECSIRDFAYCLRKWVREQRPSTVRLRVACRTSALTRQFEAQLSGAAIDVGQAAAVWKLAPLRVADVDEAARAAGFDASDFKSEIVRVRAEPFAAIAGRLSAMVRQFLINGRLAESQWEMFEAEVHALCEDERTAVSLTDGAPRLGLEDTVDFLSRAAAISIFCGRTTTWVDRQSDAPEADLTIIDVADRRGEGNVDGIEVSEPEAGRILVMAPLRPGEKFGEVTWAHRQLAEFLAARYLIGRRTPIEQIRQLLFGGLTRRILPQLHGVAAILCSQRSDILCLVAETDPHAALRADLAHLSDDDRRFIATHLLAMTSGGKLDWNIFDGYGLYQGLTNPLLASDLLPVLKNRKGRTEARELAALISEQCSLVRLVPDLARIALDRSDDLRVRLAATRTLANFQVEAATVALRKLLSHEDSSDPDNDLKGCALRGLWPDHMTATELFASLPSPTEHKPLGYYRGFVDREIIPDLSVSDVRIAVRWAVSLPAGQRRQGFSAIVAEILRIAFAQIGDTEIRHQVCELVLAVATDDPHYQSWPWTNGPEASFEVRRALAGELLKMAPDADWRIERLTFGDRALVTPGDFERLLDDAVEGGPDASDSVQIARLVFSGGSACVDSVLSRLHLNSELDDSFSFLWKPIGLASPEAAEARKYLKSERDWGAQRKRRRPDQTDGPKARKTIKALLRAFEDGDRAAYVALQWWLRVDSEGHPRATGSFGDLTSLPGWVAADGNTRQRIAKASASYLAEGRDSADTTPITEADVQADFAGYRAIRLLETLGRQTEPELLSRWAAAVATFPAGDDDARHEFLAEQAFDLASDRVIPAILANHDTWARTHGMILFSAPVARRLGGDLGDRILAISEGWSSEAKLTALRELARARHPKALTAATNQFKTTTDSEHASRLAALVVGLGDGQAWPMIWARMLADAEFGDRFTKVLASEKGDRWHNGSLPFFDAAAREQLYSWIEGNYPAAEDPVRGGGAYSVTQRHDIQALREGLLSALTDEGSPEAHDALLRLQSKYPGREWAWNLARSEIRVVEKSWSWPKPTELRALLRDPRRSLIRTGDELLELVVASIHRLQNHLHESGMSWQLWDQRTEGWKPKEEERFSDFVSEWFARDLKECGVASNREVVPRRGEKLDIYVEVLSRSQPQRAQLSVVLEVKHASHPDVSSAMKTQLANGYMAQARAHHGVYLIAYPYCARFPSPPRRMPWAKGFEASRAHFEAQAESVSHDGLSIRSELLDIGLK